MPKCNITGRSCKRRRRLVPIMNVPNVYYTFVITELQISGDTIQFTVSEVLLQPSGAKIKYKNLRGWVGNILINQLAFVLKQRQLHTSKHYLSAAGCTTKFQN